MKSQFYLDSIDDDERVVKYFLFEIILIFQVFIVFLNANYETFQVKILN